MSLFACEECGIVENTALCGWTPAEDGTGRRLVCSQCNPDMGRWHGIFLRQTPEELGLEQKPGSRYLQGKAD